MAASSVDAPPAASGIIALGCAPPGATTTTAGIPISATFAHWRGDLSGGLAGAVTAFALALTLGLIAFAQLGAEGAAVGARAGLTAAIFGLVTGTFLGTTRVSSCGPRASVALILAGFVASLAGDPELGAGTAAGNALVVAGAGACVMLAGMLQIAFAAADAGRFGRYVPYPFVAGFMTGVAVLLALAQVGPLTGTPPLLYRDPARWLPAIVPGALVLGLAVCATIVFVARRVPRWPAVVAGLAAGVVVHLAAQWAWPGLALGARVGAIAGGMPRPAALAALPDLLGSAAFARHAVELLTTAGLIAVVGSLDSLIGAVAIDAATGGRHRAQRELLAQGVANLLSGAFGGMPSVLSPLQSLTSWRAGARSHLSTLIGALVLLAVLAAGTGMLARIPLAALGGIMLIVAAGLVDRWTRSLFRRVLRTATRDDRTLWWSLTLVVAIATVTVFLGFLWAFGIGIVLSLVWFVVAMNRSLVRGLTDGHGRVSRRVWGPEDAARLGQERGRIRVVELEGAIFFGSADRVSALVEEIARPGTLVVLDLRRVTTIDGTGAVLLEQLGRRLAARNAKLLLAPVTPGGRLGRALVANGAFAAVEERNWFPDVDRALESAERALLGERTATGPREIPFADLSLAASLDAAGQARLQELLQRRTLEAGEALFREGDPGDRMYVVARGAISIMIRGPGGTDSRVATVAPGAIIGEMALIDGHPRSATATADEPSVVWGLARTDLEALVVSDPALATAVWRNLATQLTRRLRETTNIVRHHEDWRG